VNINLADIVAALTQLFRRLPAEELEKAKDDIGMLKREHEKLVGKTVMLLIAESLLEDMLKETEKNLGTLGEALADTLARLKERLARMPNRRLKQEVKKVTNKVIGNMVAALREELGYIRDDLASAGKSSTIARIIEEALRKPRVLEELHERLEDIERCRSGLDLLEDALREAQRKEQALWSIANHRLRIGSFLFATSIAGVELVNKGIVAFQSYVMPGVK
jgi:hypothetical protein